MAESKTFITTLTGAIVFFFGTVAAALDGADAPKQVCTFNTVTVRADFPAGRVNACAAISDTHIALTILPEDTPPINPSPWYAFKVTQAKTAPLTIDLVYPFGKHRYWPKISYDQQTWHPLAADQIRIKDDGSATLTVTPAQPAFYLAGQEILTSAQQLAWASGAAATLGLTPQIIGQSKNGRPVYKIETSAGADTKNYIFIVGRQHPPEVTGALALMPFVDTLFADSEQAKAFRSKFGIIIVPVVNPDGVEDGHWRHGEGGKDLNRDWGPFTQPETRLMRDQLARFKTEDTLSLFLDFHSTGRNVLYTQAESEPTNPKGFTAAWVARTQARLSDYVYVRAERPLTDQATSKNYVYTTFGVPAITYEVDDNEDRSALKAAAVVFAEEMMKILLDIN